MARSLPFYLTISTLLFASHAASADPSTAKAHFEEGARAYQEARYKDAISAFSKAYTEDPKPILLYNMAQAYERLADIPNALRAYRDFLREGASDEDREIVETRIRNLEKRLEERGLQQLSVFSAPSGARVLVAGKAVGTTPWTGELEPGSYSIELKLEGHSPVKKEVLLGAKRAQDVDVTLRPLPAEVDGPSGGEASRPDPVADESDGSAIATTTWLTLGLSAAAWAGALSFELARQGDEDDARSARTQLDHQASYDDMESKQLLSRIFLGVAAVGTIAGGIMLYLDLSADEEADQVGLGCTGGACGVFATGSF